MVHLKTTTLPNILQEYDPEYSAKPVPKVRVEPEGPSHRVNNVATPRNKKVKDRDGPRNIPPSLSREGTAEIKKRQDKERNKRIFDFWQKVKKDLREREIERLQEKVSLQHELLRVQEQQHQLRQEQRRQLEIKKREKEKADRNAKFRALQQVCQESLDEDRQAAREKRAEKREKQNKQNEGHSPSGDVSDTPTEEEPENVGSEEDPPHREQQKEAPVSPPANQPRMSVSGVHSEVFETLEEEEEEGSGDDLRRSSEEEVLPWHHVQLYQLYGKEADYFLHPKIEKEAKADVVFNPRLKAVGGRADAGALWDALRYESRMKLVQMDSKLLSPELRAAFGAFAREGLTKNRKPVMRNFYSTEDVPDMTRLMDQTRIHNAQDFRHKVELMFRSSNINQDRTKVLLYNNPPPDLNDQEGTHGIDRYLPSWAEDWDEESELSYKKWLAPKEEQEPLPIEYPTDVCKPESTHPGKEAPLTQHQHQAKSKRAEQTKYVFLTEERAATPGQFSRRRRELEETRGCPAAYSTRLPPIQAHKSQSAMAVLGNGGFLSPSQTDLNNQAKKNGRVRAQSEMSDHVSREWQPLSLNALLEYKQSEDALGRGQFGHGQRPVWMGEASVAAV